MAAANKQLWFDAPSFTDDLLALVLLALARRRHGAAAPDGCAWAPAIAGALATCRRFRRVLLARAVCGITGSAFDLSLCVRLRWLKVELPLPVPALKHLGALTSLALRGDLTDGDISNLAQLGALPALRRLDVSRVSRVNGLRATVDVVLWHLTGLAALLPNVRQLGGDYVLSNVGIPPLSVWTELTTLSLGLGIMPEHVRCLAALTALRELRLPPTLTAPGLRPSWPLAADLSGLTHVELHGCAAIARLPALPALLRLTVNSTPPVERDQPEPADLSAMGGLQAVALIGQNVLPRWAGLAALTRLHTGGCGWSDADVRAVTVLQALQHLDVGMAPSIASTLDSAAQLRRLTSLRIVTGACVPPGSEPRASLRSLAPLTKLARLGVSGDWFSPERVAHASVLTSLTALEAGCAAARLESKRPGGQTIDMLRALSAGLPDLRSLELCRHVVTDDVLRTLHGCLRRLTLLRLSRSGMGCTKAAVADLLQSRPALVVLGDGVFRDPV